MKYQHWQVDLLNATGPNLGVAIFPSLLLEAPSQNAALDAFARTYGASDFAEMSKLIKVERRTYKLMVRTA